jgi:hypothetical protein
MNEHLIRIRTDRHWLILAQTRSGKTTLLAGTVTQAIRAGLAPNRILVIDPKMDPALRALAEAHHVEHVVPRLTARGTVPPDLSSRLRDVLSRGNTLVVVDELQAVSRENDTDPIWRWVWQMGAGRGVGVWATTTRAAWIPREAVTESHWVSVFRLTDLVSLQQLRIRHPALVEAARLPPYEWLAQEIGGDPIRMPPVPWKEEA